MKNKDTEVVSKSIQAYLDESPQWSDGTASPYTPPTQMQWRIWLLTAAGKLFEGMLVFTSGILLPLLTLEFQLSSWEKGLFGASILSGILVGATLLGRQLDRWGRKKVFIGEALLLLISVVGISLSQSYPQLLFGLFFAGLALGCDYPTGHVIITEAFSSRNRGRMVLLAFACQPLGMSMGALVAYVLLTGYPSMEVWRWLYVIMCIPIFCVFLGRLTIVESPHWLALKGQKQAAAQALSSILRREPAYPKLIQLSEKEVDASASTEKQLSILTLFQKPYRRATIYASVPWFLQDLSTYGIGIFTATILATLVGEKHTGKTLSDVIYNEALAAKGALILDLFLIVGIVAAILLSDRLGRMRLQTVGFIGCAVGLAVVAIAQYLPESWHVWGIILGFVVFNFMTNMGPNSQTYLIAGEVFPANIRGLGAGFAASCGKVGAVMTSFFFPILLQAWGTTAILLMLVVTTLIGAYVTQRYGIETARKPSNQ